MSGNIYHNKNAAQDFGDDRASGQPAIPSLPEAMKKDTYSRDEKHQTEESGFWAHQKKINKVSIVIEILGLIGLLFNFSIARDSLNAAIEAANQARIQAKAAEEANALSRKSIVDVQRAFVTVSQLKVEHSVAKDGSEFLKVAPVIENSGNTPAIGVYLIVINPKDEWIILPKDVSRNVYGALSAKIGAPADPDRLIGSRDSDEFSINNFQIAPHGTVSASKLTAEMTPQNGIDAQSGRIGRFIYGSIRYFDVFNPNQHVSRFCFRIDGFFIRKLGDYELMYDLCKHWNCTDEYCEKDKESYVADVEKAKKEFSEIQQRLQPQPFLPPVSQGTPRSTFNELPEPPAQPPN